MLKPVITILLYLFTPMLFGQSLINMKHYSVQDGLSQKNVHNFIQDDNGYIWMCKQSLIPLSILSCHLLSLPHNKSITYETKELNFRCL